MILGEATFAASEDREDHAKWSFASESRARLDAMVYLARSAESIQVELPSLADPYLLNCLNGTLDLKTGRIRPHRRRDLITALCPLAYDPDALCPTYDAALGTMFNKDADLIAYWDRLCGLGLTGSTEEHILPILFGDGNNGKSTAIEAIVGMLGDDYAMVAPSGLLLKKHGEAHQIRKGLPVWQEVRGRDRDPPEGGQYNEATGQESRKQRLGHSQADEEDSPGRSIRRICSFSAPITNHHSLPVTHAIWRRLRLVPFTVTIEEDVIGNHQQCLRPSMVASSSVRAGFSRLSRARISRVQGRVGCNQGIQVS